MKQKIAIVVPTIRPVNFGEFFNAWKELIDEHEAFLVRVNDGDEPHIEVYEGATGFWWNETEGADVPTIHKIGVSDVMGYDPGLIYNRTDAVRNFGFAFAYKVLEADVIISLDDDVQPMGDTIQQHLNILGKKTMTTWMNTANEEFVRGVPYGVREEAEIVVSHGVWEGVPDLDGPTQLVKGTPELTFPKMTIPKGVLFPLCAMNFAFLRKATPYVYQAPMYGDVARFGDIWGGIEMKKDLDREGLAVVSGYARIYHTRASNVFKNLQQEARGIGMNEKYGEDEYFVHFSDLRRRWKEYLNAVESDI